MTLPPEAQHTRKDRNRKQRRSRKQADHQLKAYVSKHGDEPEMKDDEEHE